ncbi:hypothetical protein ACQ4PT_031234 [Festuca glaucescens]
MPTPDGYDLRQGGVEGPSFLHIAIPLHAPTPPPLCPSSPPQPVPPLSFRHLSPCARWSAWVAAALADPGFAPVLRSATIYDAVAASTGAVIPDRDALSALLSLWHPDSHTFRLPAGPATFSLEDAHVLAGLPPSGAPLDRLLTPTEEDIRIRLLVEKEKIKELHPCARKARRVSAEHWLEWLNPKGSELPDCVFALATRLSLGERIALGPAVVSNLYAEMDRIATSGVAEGASGRVDVWAPLWLLQVWMWERYDCLRPPELRAPEFPVSSVRLLYWTRRRRKTTREESLRVLQEEDCFEWRPYARNSLKWTEPEWFSNETVLVSSRGKDKPEWFEDYSAITTQAVLNGVYGDGIGTSTMYNPHVIARQLGYDQDAPFPIVHGFKSKGIKVWVPGICRRGAASKEYVAWLNGQFVRSQEADQYVRSEIAHEENPASSSPLNEDRRNVVGTGKKKKRDKLPENGGMNKKSKVFVSNSDDECIVIKSHDKKCEVINLDDDQEQSICDPEDNDRQLVLELEQFVRCGLFSQWEESSDEDEGGGRKQQKSKNSNIDPYAEAAMREYPLFFELIPQRPHYRGSVNSDDTLRDLACSGMWFLLVGLAREVLRTSWDTDASEVTYLMKKARKLEQNGFNVKHFISRLKEPQTRFRRLQDSMARLEDARTKEQESRGGKSLSSHLSNLKHNILTMERHLDEKKQARSASVYNESSEGIDLLEKEVEAAEKSFQAMKDEVAAMRLKDADI